MLLEKCMIYIPLLKAVLLFCCLISSGFTHCLKESLLEKATYFQVQRILYFRELYFSRNDILSFSSLSLCSFLSSLPQHCQKYFTFSILEGLEKWCLKGHSLKIWDAGQLHLPEISAQTFLSLARIFPLRLYMTGNTSDLE